jgi:hypothetical protein
MSALGRALSGLDAEAYEAAALAPRRGIYG